MELTLNRISRYFKITGWYGILVLVPHYFIEQKIGIEQPPPITHPEFYYGFVGVALAFQFVFFVIAKDPIKFRCLMPIGVFEKISFSLGVYVLYFSGRVPILMLVPATIDLLFGLGFVIAFCKTPKV